jgi:hypothetical protein
MIRMTQDQEQRGPGYVVRGDAVPEDEEYTGDQTKPMTRFQKVASALRGTGAERDEQDEYDEAGTDRDTADRDVQADRDLQAEQARRDYWDDPASGRAAGPAATFPGGRDETVAAMDPDVPVDQTNPDVPVDETRPGDVDHPATEPDMFGNTARPASGTGTVPPVAAAEGQPGAATIADVPAGASVTTATGAQEADAPETTGSTGRHAADPADRELRPGESTVPLGDFSDLTYGNLIPDATVYAEQWQQIQFRFVDDPHASVSEAADVVAQVTAKMEAAIQERQQAIAERQKAIAEQQRSLRDRWGEGNNADTENLRATLRMYKAFLDQLIGSKAS